MPQTMQVGRVHGSGTPSVAIQGWKYSGGTWAIGAVMTINAGLAQEAAATPVANILGIALQAVDTNLGFGAANSPLQVTGRKSTVSVAMANSRTIFRGSLVNNSAVVVAPQDSDVGTKYGVSKQGGVWCVDKNLTGANGCVIVVGYNLTTPDGGFVFFQFVASTLALP